MHQLKNFLKAPNSFSLHSIKASSSASSVFSKPVFSAPLSTISTVETFASDFKKLHSIQSLILQHEEMKIPKLMLVNFDEVMRKIEQKIYKLDLDKGVELLQNYQFEAANSLFDKIIDTLESESKDLDNTLLEPLKLILAEAYVQKAIALLKGGQGIMDNQQAYNGLKRALVLDPTNTLAKEKMQAMQFERGEIREDEHGNIKLI